MEMHQHMHEKQVTGDISQSLASFVCFCFWRIHASQKIDKYEVKVLRRKVD
jgi:hypothetical protein